MKDILIDDSGNLMVSGKELKIGDASEQVAQMVASAFTGEFKNAPAIGGNAKGMVAGTPDPFWSGNLKGQLERCLVDVDSVSVKNNEVKIILE